MAHDPSKLTGYRCAKDPGTPKGDCDFSRETNLGTYDCINTDKMREWEPMWFPGEKFSTFHACKHQDDMTQCPAFERARK